MRHLSGKILRRIKMQARTHTQAAHTVIARQILLKS